MSIKRDIAVVLSAPQPEKTGLWAWLTYWAVMFRPAKHNRVCNAEMCPYPTRHFNMPWCERHAKMHGW